MTVTGRIKTYLNLQTSLKYRSHLEEDSTGCMTSLLNIVFVATALALDMLTFPAPYRVLIRSELHTSPRKFTPNKNPIYKTLCSTYIYMHVC